MRLSLIILILITAFSHCCFADEWDDMLKIDTEAKNQEKTVTQAEFEKVMERFKKKPKKQKKGAALNPKIEEQSQVEIFNSLYETYPTIMIPLDLITRDGEEIHTGFYRIMSVVKPYGNFINFYQGNSLVARVKADRTDNDYGQKTLNYAKVIPRDESSIRFIYGDLDCNLETVINIKK